MFFASTPCRDNPDLFAFGSPGQYESDSSVARSTVSSGWEVGLMLKSRRPQRIAYTDTDTGSDTFSNDIQTDRWADRKIKCMKYVDDCLSVKKISSHHMKLGISQLELSSLRTIMKQCQVMPKIEE